MKGCTLTEPIIVLLKGVILVLPFWNELSTKEAVTTGVVDNEDGEQVTVAVTRGNKGYGMNYQLVKIVKCISKNR